VIDRVRLWCYAQRGWGDSWNPRFHLGLPGIITRTRKFSNRKIILLICYFYREVVMIDRVDLVDVINGEYDDYQRYLVDSDKRIRLFVDFSGMVDDSLLSLLMDIRDSEISLT
jgi:hypothetical protein